MSEKLTPYPEGSVRELLTISLPLMLSVLSANLMLFLDRLILARFDTAAMNAVVTASVVCSIFQDGAIGITAMTEIFVGHFNGARHYKKVGASVWQMIWFSLFTLALFLPLGFFAGPTLIPHDASDLLGVRYFETLMCFGFLYPLGAALSAFFIGRGEVKLVMLVVILSNILNICLDVPLVFGTPLTPSLGTQGAALGTGIAQTFQVVVLFYHFLKKHHRDNYGANLWRFDRQIFSKCFRFGLPGALSNVIELTAWSVMAQMLASVSITHITVYSIVQTIFALFTFGVSGLQKGIMNLSANQLGSYNTAAVDRSIRSGFKVVVCLILILSIPLLIFPEPLIGQFIDPNSSLDIHPELPGLLKQALHWLWIYLIFDACSWLICGVLIAAGDTHFVMIMNSLSAWLYAILPSFIFIKYYQGSARWIWVLASGYALLTSLSYFYRYKSKRWYSNLLSHANPETVIKPASGTC